MEIVNIYKDYVYRSWSFFGHNVIKFFEAEVVVGLGVIQDIRIVHHLGKFIIVESFT